MHSGNIGTVQQNDFFFPFSSPNPSQTDTKNKETSEPINNNKMAKLNWERFQADMEVNGLGGVSKFFF